MENLGINPQSQPQPAVATTTRSHNQTRTHNRKPQPDYTQPMADFIIRKKIVYL